MEIISTYRLSKVYRGGVRALDNVSFTLSGSGPHVIAGPNGAGKTTLLRILYSALLPTSGEARVLGYDVVKEAKSLRKHIATVPQEARPEPYLTPREFIELYLMARGFSRSDAMRQASCVLDIMGLSSVKNRPCLTLSGGERKRVLIAAALATNADVIFLDEPTEGLDPVGRYRVYEELKKIAKSESAIIMTTHHLSEVEEVAERVVFINKGRIIAIGNPGELKTIIVRYKYKAVVYNACRELIERFKSSDFGLVECINSDLVVYIDQSGLKKTIDMLLEAGHLFKIEEVSLDEVFRVTFK